MPEIPVSKKSVITRWELTEELHSPIQYKEKQKKKCDAIKKLVLEYRIYLRMKNVGW